jgi:hypothetical protein
MNFNAVFVLTVLFKTILLYTHTVGMQQLKKKTFIFLMTVPETHTIWNWFLLLNIIQSDHFHSLCNVFCFEVDQIDIGSLIFVHLD